jgi:nucleoid DNA-binding protein
LVEQVLSEICDTLVAGKAEKLSCLDNFVMRSKAERRPQSQGEVEGPINPRRIMVSKPSLNLKAYMNGEASDGEDQAACSLD